MVVMLLVDPEQHLYVILERGQFRNVTDIATDPTPPWAVL